MIVLKTNTIIWLVRIAFILAVAGGFVLALDRVLAITEKAECVQWKADEAKYNLWYSTSWQKQQCAHYGVYFAK